MTAERRPTHGGGEKDKRPAGTLGDEIARVVGERRGKFQRASGLDPAKVRETELARQRIDAARRERQARSAGIVRNFAAETADALAKHNVRPTHELRVKDGTKEVTKRKPGLLGMFGATVTERVDVFRRVGAWQLSISENTTTTEPVSGPYAVRTWTTTTTRTGQALGQDRVLYTFSYSRCSDHYSEFADPSLTPVGQAGRDLDIARPATDEELIPSNTVSLNIAAEDQSAIHTWRARLLNFATGLIK